MPKLKLGTMPCEGQNCQSHAKGQKVVVFRNEKNTLNYSCDWCGRSPYAREGTGQHAEWMEAIEQFQFSLAFPESQAAPGAPTPEPAKPARKPSGLMID